MFACSKFSIVSILSFDPFLADLPVLCPPGNTGGSLAFWCFQGAWMEWGYLSYLGQLMMVSFGWWCSQFMPSGGPGEHVVLGCFQGIWNGNVGQRWVEHRKQISEIKAKIQVRKKSVARKRWKSVLVCFYLSLFTNPLLFSWFSFLLNLRLLQQKFFFFKTLYDRTLPMQGMLTRSWRWW